MGVAAKFVKKMWPRLAATGSGLLSFILIFVRSVTAISQRFRDKDVFHKKTFRIVSGEADSPSLDGSSTVFRAGTGPRLCSDATLCRSCPPDGGIWR